MKGLQIHAKFEDPSGHIALQKSNFHLNPKE